ncbi:HlyD family efflux transporter periplasmic adaptor subunit [Mitsuaria sp. WAJ17]|uniref:HlyD family efflux transporter periplasmic adaptor subunit n=1 Tax=Mitsuaria sp. WAJ17 TaxID=2761452 RepID=UPI001601530F|nr:HlyD family efflux transporter periplasmic adaptor subunit [Mitsuaria sp. WAJ17]MBB2485746.1 HlyD family efflux transporter periplasmic adaptor subunit [Mitsuaria sp. WAJ17]
MASSSRDEGLFLSSLAAAQVDEPLPRVMWAVYLMLAAVVAAVVWASVAQVDMVSRSEGRVVPEGKEQVIASLDSGLLRELLVREGQQVEAGQALVRLDPTRVEAQQNEGQLRELAMMAQAARLQAEAHGTALKFPEELKAAPALTSAEAQAFQARQRLLEEALAGIDRSAALVGKELKVAQEMSAKGLMSDVEVMRLSRQVNEMRQSRTERLGRFRQEAMSELVKLQNDLAMMKQQQVVRQDALDRTVLRSPVRGLVKNIRMNTIGGVVAMGSPIMEIVPIGTRMLVEARVSPADVGFIQVGQHAVIKLSGIDFNALGGLEGKVEQISPDAIGEANPLGNDGRYYRTLIRAEQNNIRYKGETLAIIPGMTASVEIKTGERSVLSFLMRPMMRSREALRER